MPCFHTVTENDGRAYYLIPNGNGNWEKTAPDKDKEHVTNTNQSKDGRVLELVRLCKKWNKVKNAKTIPSYMLETMTATKAVNKIKDEIVKAQKLPPKTPVEKMAEKVE